MRAVAYSHRISHMKQLMLSVLENLKTDLGKVFCEEHPEEFLQDDLFFLTYTRHYGLERKPPSSTFLVSAAPEVCYYMRLEISS